MKGITFKLSTVVFMHFAPERVNVGCQSGGGKMAAVTAKKK